MEYIDQDQTRIWSTKKTLPETTDPLKQETNIPDQYPRNVQTQDIYIEVK